MISAEKESLSTSLMKLSNDIELLTAENVTIPDLRQKVNVRKDDSFVAIGTISPLITEFEFPIGHFKP